MICFRFLRAAERQKDGAGGERAEGGGAELGHAWILSGQCELSPDQSELNTELLRQSLAAVTSNRVRHFVPQDGSQPRIVAREGQDARVHRNLATGQAERIHLLVVEDLELPLVIAPAGRLCDAVSDARDLVVERWVCRDLAFL